MKTKTFSVLRATKNFRLALVILPTILAGYAAPANAAPITEEVKQRVQADLTGECLEKFLRSADSWFKFVWVIDGANPKWGCFRLGKRPWETWEEQEKKTIANCEAALPKDGVRCEVYARASDIVYVSTHDILNTAKKLFESGDISAAEQELKKIEARKLSALSDDEKGEYEYLFGKILGVMPSIMLINSKTEQRRTDAIGYFNHSWYVYKNVNAAVEEGNLRMAAGDIDRNWNWQSIREAYQYFLANASEEQKSLHPEVEQNLRQTEPYYQADLAQREAAARELAQLDAFRKKELEEQARIDAIKAEREAKQQEEIRLAEEKRIAKEGDGSPVDLTCKSYGAKPGSEGYINCRTQLARTRQLADEQEAAQKDRDNAAQKAKFVADFNSNKKCAEETQNSVCINNAGHALFNYGDKENAKGWFTLAARYGEPTAISNLSRNGWPVPEPDLLRKQQEAKSSDNVGTALMLLLGGFNAYQQGRVAGYQSVPTPIYIPAPKPTPAPNTNGYQTHDSFGVIVNSNDCYQTNDIHGVIVRSQGCK